MTKYRYTKDPKKMMTAKELYDVIQNDYENIKEFLPCRTATYIEYEGGSTEALFWNEGGKKQKIFLPLEEGWYEVDENGIPNGEKSNISSSTARYLCRYQNDDFSGPVGLGLWWRSFFACYGVGDAWVEKIDDSTEVNSIVFAPEEIILNGVKYRRVSE